MDVDFALLSDAVAQRPDGKLDIYGTPIDTIFAREVPAAHAQLWLIVRIVVTRQEAENPHRLDVILLDPDGVEIARARGDISPVTEEQLDPVPAGRRIALQAALAFANLAFPRYGDYHFAIHWDGNEARTPLPLYISPLPQQSSDG